MRRGLVVRGPTSDKVHTCSIRVRSYECDAYGHVNNATYLHYLELARHEYLRDNGVLLTDLRQAGYGLVVAKISIEYRRPAVPDDVVIVETVALRRTRVGGVLRQVVTKTLPGREDGDGPATVAEAEVTWVCVDSRGRPARLPEVFDREGLQP